MEIKYLKEEKNDIMFETDNPTICELLRVYLNNEDGVKLAVWKKEHPTKKPVMVIQTDGKDAKKILKDVITKIEGDLEKIAKEFKAAK